MPLAAVAASGRPFLVLARGCFVGARYSDFGRLSGASPLRDSAGIAPDFPVNRQP